MGLGYVWTTPHLLALMSLAFLLNLTAFPLFNGLLPYVAKEVYLTDRTGLGYMVAGASSGALVASVLLSRYGTVFRAGRVTIGASLAWYAFLLVFASAPYHGAGVAILFFAGLAQSVGQVPMAAVLLRTSDEQYRGRVMGIRMLAIYGNVPGLLIAGQLIPRLGYPLTATLYCLIGVVFTVLIAVRWRRFLWQRDAPANAR